MDILQNTFYINLEHRTDRLEHVQNELKKIGINGERFNAIKTKSGAVGCTLSHIKCLELAKERNYEEVFICEDDITFTNPKLFLENLQKFCDNDDIMWDVLIIGGNNVPPYKQYYDYCARVFNCQTTTGYIVKQDFYDIIIKNFKEGLFNLMKNPENKREYAIDIYWKKLQMENFWYMITPPTVTQYTNYSDIEGRETHYDNLLLDMNKAWMFNFNEMISKK
uniref:Glycosyl transferase family 25 domain-containing protein n=1 Tax=viral metagenome TaxID=1070528 RepID=A0A6C0F9W6_9ZZZZ|tara:strand:+ start:16216 stop:16881 length:666 start_codon:yes stop_codon:yes gene_type:complete